MPPPGRQSGTATLTPPAPPALDHTSWFDPLDPMNDSAVHTGLTVLDPLDDGTAAKAARDLIRESGRQPVLDQALLEALDAAAKAAAARRAVTIAVPVTAETPAVALPPTTVASPAAVVASAPVAVPTPAETVVAETVEPVLDVSAEFARHDDLVETGRHASVDDGWEYDSTRYAPVPDTGRHLAVQADDDHEDATGTGTPLTHRTVVTRSSGRRWIPAGVGVGVVAIVGAVLLTSGFGADASSTSTDEAARTGTSSTGSATPAATTPAQPTSGMGTIDLSGPVVVDTEDAGQPTASTARSTAAVQPQVAAPPAARTSSSAPAVSGSGSGTGTGSGTGSSGNTGTGGGSTATTPATLTASTTVPTTAPTTTTESTGTEAGGSTTTTG
ncbi:hypothetical protein [Klenkia soli]|uniref:hypothetical protein n=1 Tax=Klenkia soli TaxID=1052260 RepID=UPI000B81DC1A|nr:hypothetical protein [Klenkia soli]